MLFSRFWKLFRSQQLQHWLSFYISVKCELRYFTFYLLGHPRVCKHKVPWEKQTQQNPQGWTHAMFGLDSGLQLGCIQPDTHWCYTELSPSPETGAPDSHICSTTSVPYSCSCYGRPQRPTSSQFLWEVNASSIFFSVHIQTDTQPDFLVFYFLFQQSWLEDLAT